MHLMKPVPEDQIVRCRHPVWVMWTARLGLPLMGLGSVYLIAFVLFTSENFEPLVILSITVLGGLPLYMSIISLRVLPFLASELTATADGIEIRRPDQMSVSCPWQLVGKVKRYATSSVVVAYRRDGTRLFAIFEQIRNYRQLTYFLDSYTESNLSGAKIYTKG